MSIEKSLVCSTGHITFATMEQLRDNSDSLPLIIYGKGDVGFLVYVHPEMAMDIRGIPTELLALIREAHANDCVWLMLDCDGDMLPGFETFDW